MSHIYTKTALLVIILLLAMINVRIGGIQSKLEQALKTELVMSQYAAAVPATLLETRR